MLLLLLFLLLSSTAFAQGNETIYTLPDSNKATFRVDSRNFWKNEIPRIMHKYAPKDFVVSGGVHNTAGSCVSPSFFLEGFTNVGNRVTADGAGGATTINYGAVNIGGNCVSDTCWVAASPVQVGTIPLTNFQRVGTTNIYVDCTSPLEPVWPDDTTRLMKVTLAGGAINAVTDLRQSSSFALSGTHHVTAYPYSAVCDGVTDATAGIQKALDIVPAGSRVVLPAGTCMLTQQLTISKNITLEGSGIQNTILRQTMPTLPVIVVSAPAANETHIRELAVDHGSVTAITGGDGIIVDSIYNHVYLDYVAANYNMRGFVLGCVAFGIGSHLQATNNNLHGFEFIYPSGTCGAAQWQVNHSLSQLNRGVGFSGTNTTSASGIGPFLDHTHSFGNDFGGYVFIGTSGFPINDLFLLNVLSSADNRAGIYLNTYGAANLISNPWIELTGQISGFTGWPIGWPSTPSAPSNMGHCIEITANNQPGTSVNGGYLWNCAWSGVAIDAPFTSLIGGSTYSVGIALDANLARRANVHIGANGVTVEGHTFNYIPTGVVHYIHFGGVITQIDVGHNAYAPGIALGNILGVSDATLAGTFPPAMVAGMFVHSNTAGAPGLMLYDATNGANPLKLLRVTLGNLQILNSAGSAAIHTLSDAGTPGWFSRRGTATIADANITANVALSPIEPDIGYFVQVTAASITGTPAAASFTVIGINKLTTGFELVILGPPGAGASVTFNWLVHR